jgi:cytochrome c oxidase subunit I
VELAHHDRPQADRHPDRREDLQLTVGAFILAFSFVVFIYNALITWRSEPRAPADPWNGATLEWSTPSPPPEWNFTEIPTVDSRDPLWCIKHKRGGPLPEPSRETGERVHMPPPSYWPLVTAFGVPGIFVGLLASPMLGPWGIVAGLGVLFFGFFHWVFEKGYSEFTTPGYGAQ